VWRGIAVTDGGKLLLDEARDLVNRAEAVKLAMREFTGLARGRLAIKASQTIASHFLPPRLVDFHQAYPGVALIVSVGNSTEVVEAIIRGEIELGFVEGPEEEFGDPRLAVEMIELATDLLRVDGFSLVDECLEYNLNRLVHHYLRHQSGCIGKRGQPHKLRNDPDPAISHRPISPARFLALRAFVVAIANADDIFEQIAGLKGRLTRDDLVDV
jgi:DNA-binding transcriptional LysR family regulator